jgi:hypothetical protein
LGTLTTKPSSFSRYSRHVDTGGSSPSWAHTARGTSAMTGNTINAHVKRKLPSTRRAGGRRGASGTALYHAMKGT